jgi:hypothetical protein
MASTAPPACTGVPTAALTAAPTTSGE